MARHPEPTLTALFQEQARRRPEAVAVRCEGAALTYRELERAANRLASTLRSRGVGSGDVVGVCTERCIGQVVAVLGVLGAGAAYLPLGPAHPEARTRDLLAAAGARALIAARTVAGRLPPFPGPIVWLGRNGEGPEGGSDGGPPCGTSSRALAYVIYTSGSTGAPKGVEVEHHQVVSYVLSVTERLGMGEGERYAMVQPLTVDSSVTMLFGSLLRGGCLHLVPEETALDGDEMRRLVREEAIDHLKIAPSHLAALRGESGGILPRRRLVIGGEGSSWRWARELAAEGDCAVFNHYGPTETTVGVLAHGIEPDETGPAGTTPLGLPLPGCQAYVLDGLMRPVPAGVPGELYVGGSNVARGYRGRPGATAAVFVPDPFGPDEGCRLYRTGDVVRERADGVLEFLGRRDDQVKVRGHRVETGEVQAALESHPAVRECAVLPREAAGDVRLVAYVAGADDLTDAVLAEHVTRTLPAFMAPSRYVRLDALPRTEHGKVDRKALAALTAADSPAVGEPRTDVEHALVDIWREVLGVRAVGVDSDFFALGGHSLLAMRLMGLVRERLGVAVPLRALFEAPTVAALAERLADPRSTGPAAPAIRRVPRGAPLPASYGQRRLWTLQKLAPEDSSYNTWRAWRLRGALDAGALERALRGLVARHEVLRSRFVMAGGEPAPEVLDGWAPALDVARADSEGAARRTLEAEVSRPFDLGAGPPLRVKLLALGERDHVLLVLLHHAVTDGRSLDLLERELWARYAGEWREPPPGGVEYADFAVWQRRWLEEAGEGARQLAHWRERLRGVPRVLELAADRVRGAERSWAGAHRPFKLGREETRRLRELSRVEGVTLYTTLLAAFDLLLWRYSGQRELLVGTPVSGRGRPEIEDVLGFFVNTVLLPADLGGRPTFRELLARTKGEVLDALSNQDVPFEKLVEELGVEREPSRPPLFQVLFAMQGRDGGPPTAGATAAGLDVSRLGLGSEREKFDLSLSVREGEDELYGSLGFSTELFDDRTAKRMLRRYRRLLDEVVATPSRTIEELGLPHEHEVAAVLAWGGRTDEEPPGRSVEEEIAERARERPGAVALESDGTALTYGQLVARAGEVAGALLARGVRAESRVGLLAERGAELVVGLLGILRAGAAFVPLDPGLPAERLEHVARDAGIAHLVVGQRWLRGLLPLELDGLVVEDPPGAAEAPGPAPSAAGDGLAYVMYTSGSTGRPKGVAVTRRGLASYVRWASRTYGPGGSVVHSSIGFDLTLTSLLVPLVRGERVELLPEDGGIDALGDALAAGRRYGLVKLTPAHLEVLNRRPDAAELRGRVGALVVGGEQLWGRAAAPWIDAGVEVFNEYGPTETVVGCVVYRAGEVAAGAVPIGRPAPGVRVCVLADDLRPVGEGMVGELCVGGPQVARGYWGRPAETAERFVPDPWGGPGDRLYRTGDLVRWGRDAELTYVGRRDRQLKVRGHRVEPGEIEAVMREHEAVAEAAVAARGAALVGYVVWCGPDRSVELRGWLRRRLPRPLLPGAIVGVDELPLTPSGKVDLDALAGLRVPVGGGARPATDDERSLAAIWEDLLGLDEVGLEDDFFDLGGHSLLAIQLFERIRADLGVDLPPRVIFEAPAIVDLAREVAAARQAGVPAGQPASEAIV